jgi:hypothetical protein
MKTKQVKIDPDLQTVIPPLSDDKSPQPASNLRAEGCREPIQARGKQGTPKKRRIPVAKLIAQSTVKPLPFMVLRNHWFPYHVLEGLTSLGTIPEAEHSAITTFMEPCYHPNADPYYRSAFTGVEILKNLSQYSPDQRQYLYTLAQSQNDYERSLAWAWATKKATAADLQRSAAKSVMYDLESLRQQQTTWQQDYTQEPWSAEFEAITQALAALQDKWRFVIQCAAEVEQHRIAPYIAAFLAKGGDTEGTA